MPDNKLYNALNKAGYYTKSETDFNQQFSTPEAQDKLYQKLNGSGFYTKSSDDFKKQFFGTESTPSVSPDQQQQQEQPTQPEVKERPQATQPQTQEKVEQTPTPVEKVSKVPDYSFRPDSTERERYIASQLKPSAGLTVPDTNITIQPDKTQVATETPRYVQEAKKIDRAMDQFTNNPTLVDNYPEGDMTPLKYYLNKNLTTTIGTGNAANEALNQIAFQGVDEKNLYNKATENVEFQYIDRGGMSPVTKMNKFNQDTNGLKESYEQKILLAKKPEDVKAILSDYNQNVNSIAKSLGLDVTDSGAVSVPKQELDDYISKVQFQMELGANEMGKENAHSYAQDVTNKLASGLSAFYAGMIDLAGVTGLNQIEGYRQLGEGQRMNAEILAEQGKRYEQSTLDMLASGDVFGAAGNVVLQTVETLPAMLPFAASPEYGMYIFATSGGLQKYKSLEDNKDVAEWQKVTSSILTGVNMAVWGKAFVTPVMAASKQAVLEVGEKEARNLIGTTIKKSIESGIEKTFGQIPMTIKQGIGMVSMGIGNDIIDKGYIDPELKIGTHAVDDFILGAVMYKAFDSPNAVVRGLSENYKKTLVKTKWDDVRSAYPDMDFQRQQDLVGALVERQSLIDADTKLDPELKGKYAGKISGLNKKIVDIKFDYEGDQHVFDEQLKYLKDKGVDVPNGTTMEQLDKIYKLNGGEEISKKDYIDKLNAEHKAANNSETKTEKVSETETQPTEVQPEMKIENAESSQKVEPTAENEPLKTAENETEIRNGSEIPSGAEGNRTEGGQGPGSSGSDNGSRRTQEVRQGEVSENGGKGQEEIARKEALKQKWAATREENKARLGAIFDDLATLTGARKNIEGADNNALKKQILDNLVEYVKSEFSLAGEKLHEKVREFLSDYGFTGYDEDQIKTAIKEKGYAEETGTTTEAGSGKEASGMEQGTKGRLRLRNNGKNNGLETGQEGSINSKLEFSDEVKNEVTQRSVKSKMNAILKIYQAKLNEEITKLKDTAREIKAGINKKGNVIQMKIDDVNRAFLVKEFDENGKKKITISDLFTKKQPRGDLREQIEAEYNKQQARDNAAIKKEVDRVISERINERANEVLAQADKEIGDYLDARAKETPTTPKQFNQQEGTPTEPFEPKTKTGKPKPKQREKLPSEKAPPEEISSHDALKLRIRAEIGAVKDAMNRVHTVYQLIKEHGVKFLTDGQMKSIVNKISSATNDKLAQSAIDYTVKALESADYRENLGNAKEFLKSLKKNKKMFGFSGGGAEDAATLLGIKPKNMTIEDLERFNNLSLDVFSKKSPDMGRIQMLADLFGEYAKEPEQPQIVERNIEDINKNIASLEGEIKKGINGRRDAMRLQRRLGAIKRAVSDLLMNSDQLSPDSDAYLDLQTKLGKLDAETIEGGTIEQSIEQQKQTYYDNIDLLRKHFDAGIRQAIKGFSEEVRHLANQILQVSKADIEKLSLASLEQYEMAIKNLSYGKITPDMVALSEEIGKNKMKTTIFDRGFEIMRKSTLGAHLLAKYQVYRDMSRRIDELDAQRMDTATGNFNKDAGLSSLVYYIMRGMNKEHLTVAKYSSVKDSALDALSKSKLMKN